MSGTVQGGKAAAITNKAKDADFYRKIGAMGGKVGRTGGFYAATPEQRIAAGRKGGTISRRGGQPKVPPNLFTRLFRRTK